MNAAFIRRLQEIRERNEKGASEEAPSPVTRCRDEKGRFVACGKSHA